MTLPNFLVIGSYLSFFGRDQILVALSDDLRENPGSMLLRIWSFLGVDPPVSAPFVEPELRASAPRHAASFHTLKRFALWLRRHDLHRMLEWGKTNPLLVWLLTKPLEGPAEPPIRPQTRERFMALHRPHIVSTAEIIGRDLSAWM